MQTSHLRYLPLFLGLAACAASTDTTSASGPATTPSSEGADASAPPATSAPDAASGAIADAAVTAQDATVTGPQDAGLPASGGPADLVLLTANVAAPPAGACGFSTPTSITSSDFFKFPAYMFNYQKTSGLVFDTYLIQLAGPYSCGPTGHWAYRQLVVGPAGALPGLVASPPPPFVGPNVTIPIAAKSVSAVELHYYIKDGTKGVLPDLFVHNSTDLKTEQAFLQSVCAPNSAVIATSAKAAQAAMYVHNGLVDEAGVSVVLHFADGTSEAYPYGTALLCSSNPGGPNIP